MSETLPVGGFVTVQALAALVGRPAERIRAWLSAHAEEFPVRYYTRAARGRGRRRVLPLTEVERIRAAFPIVKENFTTSARQRTPDNVREEGRRKSAAKK